jgi:ATP-dependent helicase/DNAse subunit B
MSLSVIAGPPNSGRTGAVLDRFREALSRDPVLVVPTVDDVERFEGELTQDGAPLVGATVCTFGRLFALVAGALDVPVRPLLSPVQGRRVAAEAVSRSTLKLLAPSARQPGFATALEELISELQAAGIDPHTFRERAAEAGDYELELAGLYESFRDVREELDRDDDHTVAAAAIAALRSQPDAWGGRPVFIYGFDDLTVEQLDLARELWSATEVTIALPWEDRPVLTAARGALFAQLRDVDGVHITHLDTNPEFTRSRTLFELERRFGEEGAEPVENDGGLALLAAAGELAEAETIGAEIARLLDKGVPASEIAVVVRDPGSAGPLLRRVLSRFEIPVAVQADLAVTRTLTGAGLVSLLQAAVGRGLATDLLAYLRTPGIARPDRIDWLDRKIRRDRLRTAEQALVELRKNDAEDRRPSAAEFDELRQGAAKGELLVEAGRQARWLAERKLYRSGAVAGEDRALELRAGAELERALQELADLGLDHQPADVIAAVTELRVPMWRGPTQGLVRVISPYRARARRVGHIFVASLQDGDFPRRDTGGPLLSDDARSGLELPPRKKAEVEDRYLFSVLLSRPKWNLWLSWRSADDEGGDAARSPFVDEVRDLLTPALPAGIDERDQALFEEARGKGLADSVFSPGDAPTLTELARSAAARVVPDQLRRPVQERLDSVAAERTQKARLRPSGLSQLAVAEAMAAKDLFGPTTLEEYAVCPYRWFVQRELNPQSIDPEGEALTAGSVAHLVLERLYLDPPVDERRPTADSVDQWLARAKELAAELGPEKLPREHADTAATLRRVEGLVVAFLIDEARAGAPFQPDTSLTEASFGDEDSEKKALQLNGGGIHGRIDRIDRGPGGEALIQDYKSGSKVEGGTGMLDKGKLQLQLYLLAVRELWGLEVAGAIYRPLGGTSPERRQPKGLLRKELQEDLAPMRPRPKDQLSDEDFDAALDAARLKAEEIIGQIQSGRVTRDPIDGRCPKFCSYQPICRRERGLPEEEPDPEGEPFGDEPE